MGIHNHFWSTSQKKEFKMNILRTVASAVILTLRWFSAVLAHCGVEFQKKISSACSLEHTWTLVVKQFFSPMHTVGVRVTESKKQSNHGKSGQQLQCPGTAVGWKQKFFLYHQGRQDR
jgi:hypothetical protein